MSKHTQRVQLQAKVGRRYENLFLGWNNVNWDWCFKRFFIKVNAVVIISDEMLCIKIFFANNW